MAVDTRKRQKKLEKQKAKKKAEQREQARRQSQGISARLAACGRAPILHCSHARSLFEFGLGNVLISRQLSSGDVAFVIFLVDVQCLGVKKVHADIVPRAIYENRIYDKLVAHEGVVNIEPAAARKLVEGAVAYAESLGLPPYHEYRVGRLIFSDISVESCTREFTYGRNGKPYFFAGPYDDAARCRDIMQTLERVCGPGGYHYTIPVSPEEIDHDSVEPSEE